ncbi:MAG TPA: alpha/beta fold hydrolase [Alphaproteobacteria bacterium]|nr:alpha/beta fold hydrolase [Alphaproteobacteria bacterium]
MLNQLGALAALPAVRAGSFPWTPRLATDAAELIPELQAVELPALQEAVARECRRRLEAMMAGVHAYQAAPEEERLHDLPVLWQEGTTRLLDYGGQGDGEGGPPVLFVPSLINRAYVLDLADDLSLLRWLAQQGLRPLLVDWDSPGEVERGFGLADYVARLNRALDAVLGLGAGPVGLVGYCMGGNLALPLALRRQADLSGLALLATPWDFHAERSPHARLLATVAGAVEAVTEAFGELPVDLLQAFFAMLDPASAQRKFRRFAEIAETRGKAARFVQLEDWLNDGVPLTAPVARECLRDWYLENRPGRGDWQLADRPVRPQALALPALLAIPANDRIVPPGMAWPLARLLPDVTVISPAAGHIGMVVGGQAEAGLWRPLADWLRLHGDID